MNQHAARLPTPEELPGDEFDRALRPRRLEDFVGQERIKDQLSVSIEAAANRGEALDHVLLAGPPGLGKTSLAQIVAAELGVPFVQTAGPALERKGDVASYLTALEPRAVFFVDEIHRLPRALEETFYPAMEDTAPADHRRTGSRSTRRHAAAAAVHADRRDDADGSADDAAARPVRDPASARALRTRRPGADRPPIGAAARGRDRGRRRGRDREPQPGHAAGRQPAAQTRPRLRRGPPRRRRHRGGRAAPRSTCSRSTTRGSIASTAEILRAICERFSGGPVGLSTLAVAVGEEQDTIEDVYEPYLLQRGLIERTPRGRAATARAYEHLELEPPGPRRLL